MEILVTTYTNPDLDGVASAFAYSEFLRKNGKTVKVAVFGIPHRESRYVLKRFNILELQDADRLIDRIDEFIVVDASDTLGLSGRIDPSKVIEIIDHRKVHNADKFPNAIVQIELVGSAATLIAEKFYDSKTPISEQSSALLYSAIVSNTINFKANVTTTRDHRMADWLTAKFTLPENYVHDMFMDKTRFDVSIKETIINDFAKFQFDRVNLGIGQLELIDALGFINKNHRGINDALLELKLELSLDYVFLTCVDLEKASNSLVVIDKNSQELVQNALDIKFDAGVAKRDGILMRKEIVPLIKQALEMNKQI